MTAVAHWTTEEDVELMRHVDPTWPNGAFVARLKRPASVVAEIMTRKFGRRITKNAVISRKNRLRRPAQGGPRGDQ
jgi:hypothetical protein